MQIDEINALDALQFQQNMNQVDAKWVEYVVQLSNSLHKC